MAPPGGGGTQVARAGAPAAAGAPAQAQPQQSFGGMLFGVVRMGIFWYFAMQMFAPKKPSNPDLLTNNLFMKGEDLDFWMYTSESREFKDFSNEEALIWHETKVPYAVWTPGSTRRRNYTFTPSEAVQKHNASIFAHVFFARSGYSPDPQDADYMKEFTFSRTHPLVIYLPKPKVDNRKSLLSKDAEGEQLTAETETGLENKESEEGEERIWISFWKPNITINLVDDFTRYPRGGAPPTIAEHLNVDENTGNYFPTVYFNEFWLLRDKLKAINETVDELYLEMELGPISLTRWQLYLQIDQSFQIHRSYGSMIEGEADELKRVFVEGNPILLAVTMAVSLLHSVFDFLAFKNDIQFWNKNKSMEGLSARSVVINFFCQLIVFLYLLDNDTSWVILLSSGVGCCIEFWKIGKAMIIEVDRSGRFPLLRFKHRESYAGNKTKEYDDLAMKYLSYALYPIVACFAIYSLMYERHRSWYSWILSSLTSCVYTFGFIMMCPQLFINYKLKSVAHLPWRQMTYKFLNTIIDDLFAFVIKMPWLHRLSVFRDDVIFLIYLYQRWVYPVDKKRVNEFGFGGAEADGSEPSKAIAASVADMIIKRPGESAKEAKGVRRTAGSEDGSKAAEGSSSSTAAEETKEGKKKL
ncbi:hypothetical protein Mapa_016523 [Marchantia paleacea]|nr:hypothetical protein Mapa_016523 [Marchantia paleacea]